MATLHVRNLPDDLYGALQDLAVQEQRSLGAEIIVLLERALDQERVRNRRSSALARIARRRRSFRAPEGTADSLKLLREDRAR